jgi:multidrug resistance protein, MATE family
VKNNTLLCQNTEEKLKQQGLASALETLCGQAYGAAKHQKLASNTYGAIVSLLVVCIPLSFVWFSVEHVLSFIGQDPHVAHEAAKYSKCMIPSLLAYAIIQPMMRFLQAQSLIFPMVMSSVISLCIHIPLCWTLVFKSGLGNVGAALAISTSYWVNAIILGLYIKYSESCKMTRAPPSMDAIRGIPGFLRLAIPSAIMLW